jgi:hypothetical protein
MTQRKIKYFLTSLATIIGFAFGFKSLHSIVKLSSDESLQLTHNDSPDTLVLAVQGERGEGPHRGA